MDELAQYGIQDTPASVLFCLQSDLSSRDGGPSLSNWELLTSDELFRTLEKRWTHVVAALASQEDSKPHELANNGWGYLSRDRTLIVSRWKALLKVGPPDEPSKTVTHRDRTPTPPSSINGEEGGTDDVGPPCDTPQPNTLTTRHVHTPIPAPDEETSPVSVSRGQPMTHVDSPSPAPSMARDEGEEISAESLESDTEMLEPPSPKHLTEAPPTTTKRQPGPVCPHCEAQRDSIRDLVVHAQSCPRTPPSARAKTTPIIATICVLCNRNIKAKSLWKHEQSPHFIFPCLAIATERGHPKCPECKARLKEGCKRIDLNPIEYLMSEPKGDGPLDDGPIGAEPIDASVFAILSKLAGILRSEERTLLLRYPKDILATELHDALARTEAMTEPSQHADGGIDELLPNGHVQGHPIDTDTASRGTEPRHDATWRPNDKQPSVRQSIEVHTVAIASDLPSLVSSTRSASETSINHGLLATPPTPPIPVLGKRKREEQNPPGGSTSGDRMRHRGLTDNDALASIVCSASSHAGDPLPSQKDDVPEIIDQTARSPPPAVTATTTQHVQCARPEIGAVPSAKTSRLSFHHELYNDAVMEFETGLAPPDHALPESVPRESTIMSRADDQFEHPPISTHDKPPDQAGSGIATPGPFFAQNDLNPRSLRDDDSSVPGPHNPNKFDRALPSGTGPLGAAETTRGLWPGQADIGIHAQTSALPTSSSQQSGPQTREDVIALPSPSRAICLSPPIIAATSDHPLPGAHRPGPRSSTAMTDHLSDGDLPPNKRQRIFMGDHRFHEDSQNPAHALHPASFSTLSEEQGTDFLDNSSPVKTGSQYDQSQHIRSEAAVQSQISYVTETVTSDQSNPSSIFNCSYEISASRPGLASVDGPPRQIICSATSNEYQGSYVVEDMTTRTDSGESTPVIGASHLPTDTLPDIRTASHRLRWYDVAVVAEPTLPQDVPTQQLRSASMPRIEYTFDLAERSVITAKLRPEISEGIQNSLFWKDEIRRKAEGTGVIITHHLKIDDDGQGWIIQFTVSSSYGRHIDNALKSGARNLKGLFGHEYMEAITAVEVIYPHDDPDEDCQLQFAIDEDKGGNLVKFLHRLKGSKVKV